MPDIDVFKDLVTFCREAGVSRAKFGEIEFVLEDLVEEFEEADVGDISTEEVLGFKLIGGSDDVQ